IEPIPQTDHPTPAITQESTDSATHGEVSVGRNTASTGLASAKGWHDRGTALQKAGHYGEARTAFREARRLAPHDTDIVVSLAHLEMECGRHQHAYDLFQMVIRKFPLQAAARIHAARSCHELGRKKRARALISGWRCLHLDSDESAELGALLIQLGRVSEGLSILDGLIDLPQVSPHVVVYVVTALEQASILDKARLWAIMLPSPAQVRSPAMREEILTWHARLAWRDGDLATARKLLKFLDTPRATGSRRNAEPYWLLAEVCFQQSDYEAVEAARANARAALNKAADIACLRGYCHLRRSSRANRSVTSQPFPLGALA
ncbi:MAG: tetratricopeptide repeat protein, partial [Rhodanobacteraceae bacterium]